MIEPVLIALLPDVPAWGIVALLLAGVLGAFVTTAFGAGGGVLLLAVLPVFLPVAAVIPVHGVLQAGSNGLRTGLLIRHIRWPLLLAFTGGGLIGTAIGASLFVRLPEAWLEFVLGGFILWTCWGRAHACGAGRCPWSGSAAASPGRSRCLSARPVRSWPP